MELMGSSFLEHISIVFLGVKYTNIILQDKLLRIHIYSLINAGLIFDKYHWVQRPVEGKSFFLQTNWNFSICFRSLVLLSIVVHMSFTKVLGVSSCTREQVLF